MNIKTFLLSSVLFIALSLTKVKAQTVYITETGKKYHSKNCSIVKTGKKGISLKDARKEGYEPCKGCKADEIVALVDKKKTGSTKK
jgi:hypothetical protein